MAHYKNKKLPRHCFKLTNDFTINLNKKYWFIEVENYYWQRFANVRFKNTSFRDWLNYIIEPSKPYINIKVAKQPIPKTTTIKSKIRVGGYYELDKRKCKPLHIRFWHWGWPEYSEAGRKEWVMHEYIKTLVHELNHAKQHHSRNNIAFYWDGGYYEDPNEIDSYALNTAQALVARFGTTEAKKKIGGMKTKDTFCSELINYSKLENTQVKHKFMKKTLKYIEVYESYEREWGEDYLFCFRIRKGQSTSRQKIKELAY